MDDSENIISAFNEAIVTGLPSSWDWRQPVVIAVSGGADSVALLHALHAVAPTEARRQMLVAHAEHGLRETAARDRRFVVEQAEGLGLPCHWQQLPVMSAQGVSGEGIEATARQLRYSFFSELAHAHGARHVAVGHTLDDQAETILQRIFRGTGIAGLAGMPRVRQLADGVGLLRPLLDLRRWQVREYLRACGLLWMEDETNADIHFSRNFLRHRVLAEVEQGPYPAATEAIVRLGEQAAGLMAGRRADIERFLNEAVERQADGSLLLPNRLAGLVREDGHLLADLLLDLWQREGWPRQGLSHRHLDTLARMVIDHIPDGSQSTAISLPGAIEARRQPEGVVLRRFSKPGLSHA